MNEQVCEAFAKLCDLGLTLGAAPMNKHAGCWERQIDKKWWISFNGHPEAHKNSKGLDVEPFHCYVEYNGWPAGLFTPYGGVIAGGEAANESAFIRALVRARADALGVRLPDADDPEGYAITIGLADEQGSPT